MGLLLKDYGPFSIEIRRESFRLYTVHGSVEPPNCDVPEWYLTDIQSLIDCLEDAKKYIERRGEYEPVSPQTNC